jgi:catechol 2,3-dioxygenase-like lactoylglutathione lyase family enzyme
VAQSIGAVTLLVRDYDEAIEYFCSALRFELVADQEITPGKRWVRVRPPGSSGTSLLLAKAVGSEQVGQIGRQASGRVFLFLYTDDFARDHGAMRAAGVIFREEPRQESYGTVAVFEDLYGNRWDLLQPRPTPQAK